MRALLPPGPGRPPPARCACLLQCKPGWGWPFDSNCAWCTTNNVCAINEYCSTVGTRPGPWCAPAAATPKTGLRKGCCEQACGAAGTLAKQAACILTAATAPRFTACSKRCSTINSNCLECTDAGTCTKCVSGWQGRTCSQRASTCDNTSVRARLLALRGRGRQGRWPSVEGN